MSNEQSEQTLLIGARDGTIYAIPASVVEAHRLSDDQRTALAAELRADGVDVEGFSSFFDQFQPFQGTFGSGTPGGVAQYDPSHPDAGGWDGVGLRYVRPVVHAIGRRKTP